MVDSTFALSTRSAVYLVKDNLKLFKFYFLYIVVPWVRLYMLCKAVSSFEAELGFPIIQAGFAKHHSGRRLPYKDGTTSQTPLWQEIVM